MTTVADILKYVETLAPTYMKMDWDNVGLLCGSREPPVTQVLVALDPFDPTFDARATAREIKRRSSGIKRVLLDQRVVSGIGNIYADEALWRAGIHGERPASALTKPAIERLLGHAREVMAEALEQGGTSFDALYVNVNGASGQLNIALKRVEGSRRRVISQSDLARQALTKRLESPTCSAAHRRSFGSRSLRGASHA